ncbi:MAG TPA: low temperature requirement protein A [Solirubrobacteraceae bacterium]|nr:low temperature requirement protein A [Solirubrobacteraceae bacterium]
MTEVTSPTRAPGRSPAVDDPAEPERRTNSVELFWDLVFVFAVTQVTTLLFHHLSWAGFGRAMLILALMWWAWSAFVWAANAQADDSRALRLILLLSSAFVFIAGLALPQAFGAEGMLFAVAYAVVRLLHLALYADASRRGRASWSSIAGFSVTAATGMALLIVGAALHDGARIALWGIAVAIDYAGPAWLTRDRLRGLQRVAVAHFAERYSLFVIICLGESIVDIGVGAASSHSRLSFTLVAVVALGLITTAAMWWTYFDRLAGEAEQRLRTHHDAVLAAADGYSYLHLVIVAGIIIFAAGVRLQITAINQTPVGSVRLAICGGLAIYLLGQVAFAARLGVRPQYEKAATAVALLVLFAVTAGVTTWVLAVIITALLVGLCLAEQAPRSKLRRPGAPDLGLP